jgi:tRNA threonylcarbamoyl adenosine modification protein YjeE
VEIYCENQQQTEAVARQLAALARPGDLFALTGDLGAGKSTFARAFIRASLGKDDAEVPSPTFTLVQSYAAGTDIHHADLYRLSGPEDVYDLGLDEERDNAVLLVEWPDRMPNDWWQDAIEITLKREGAATEAGDEARQLSFNGNANRLTELKTGFKL